MCSPGYVAGIPRAVLKGGRYDYLMQRFTPGANAIGFAIYLDELERLAAPLPPVQQQGREKTWLNIAPPKGAGWVTRPTSCWPGRATAPPRITMTPASWW